jgi:hypothetical protein
LGSSVKQAQGNAYKIASPSSSPIVTGAVNSGFYQRAIQGSINKGDSCGALLNSEVDAGQDLSRMSAEASTHGENSC